MFLSLDVFGKAISEGPVQEVDQEGAIETEEQGEEVWFKDSYSIQRFERQNQSVPAQVVKSFECQAAVLQS